MEREVSNSVLNFRETPSKEYVLFLRRLLPQSVSKCQGDCFRRIGSADLLVVRTYGTTVWNDVKTGQQRTRKGHLYVHFQDECLKRYEKKENEKEEIANFDFGKIKVDPKSLDAFSNDEKEWLKSFNIKF